MLFATINNASMYMLCTYNLTPPIKLISLLKEIAVIKDHTDFKESQILPGCTPQDGRHHAILPVQFDASPSAVGITTFWNFATFIDKH